jgi:hypothetical protein
MAATAAVFIFARPEYHPTYVSKMIDFSKLEHHSAGTVREAFAQRGVRLSVVSHFNGMSNDAALRADALQVIVAPETGSGSWGPRLEPYDERFDNLLVTYGGGISVCLTRLTPPFPPCASPPPPSRSVPAPLRQERREAEQHSHDSREQRRPRT